MQEFVWKIRVDALGAGGRTPEEEVGARRRTARPASFSGEFSGSRLKLAGISGIVPGSEAATHERNHIPC